MSVEINATNFPDEVFRDFLSNNYDTDNDGWLSDTEIAAITSINLYQYPYNTLSSFEGSQYLTNLKGVRCAGGRNIVSIDVSLVFPHNSNFELYFDNCSGLKSIDAAGCTWLKILKVMFSHDVEEVDVSGCTSLEEFEFYPYSGMVSDDIPAEGEHFALECVDVHGCSSLKSLRLDYQQLTSIDLTGCINLENFSARDNLLSSIDVSMCQNLKFLDLSINLLTAIDIKNLTLLERLSIDINYLQKLILPSSSTLRILNCRENEFQSLNISKCSTLVSIYEGDQRRSGYTGTYYGSRRFPLIDGKRTIYSGNYPVWSSKSNTEWMLFDRYTVIVANADDEPIIIITQPVDQEIIEDGSATFNVEAVGDNLSYTWQVLKNEESNQWFDIEGQNLSSLTILWDELDNPESIERILYRCQIINDEGSVYTDTVALTIALAPEIGTNPASINVIEGETGTFVVTANGNNLSYQWQFSSDNGITWSDIHNSNSSSLNVIATLSLDGYKYRCVVTNDLGTATSNAATLTVTADTSVSKPIVTSQPISITVAEGNNATFAVSANGSDISYQWQVFKNNQWQSIIGETNSSCVVSATRMLDGSRYRCVVSNAAGAVYSNEATLTVSSGVYVSTPQILTHPKSANVDLGEVVTFWVRANGGGLTYQWQKFNDGSWYDITGAVGNTYTLTARIEIHNTRYRCVITNTAGSVYSNSATLSIRAGQDLSFYGYHSIIISGKNTYGEWEMYPTSRPHVAPPEVKTSYVDLPGADGGLDYTDLLTGEPRYGYRKGSWEFLLIPQDKWASTYRSLVSFLHGRQHTVILEDDPDYVYTGRLSVNEWQSAAHNSLITIDYILEPHARNISGEEEDAREAEILDAANELLSKAANTGMVIAKVAGEATLVYPDMLFEDGDNIAY